MVILLQISILYTYRDGAFYAPFLKCIEADKEFHDFYANKLNKVGIVYAHVLNYSSRHLTNWKFVDPTSVIRLDTLKIKDFEIQLKSHLGHPDPEPRLKDQDKYQERIAEVAKYYIDEWHAFNSAKVAQVFFSALRTVLR